MILKTYGLEWGKLEVQEAPIQVDRAGDTVSATLGGGQMATMKLQREAGADGKGVVLRNVKYFGAQNNDGFEMYRSLEHSADVGGHKFSYSDRNAFLISIDTHEGEGGGMSGQQVKGLRSVLPPHWRGLFHLRIMRLNSGSNDCHSESMSPKNIIPKRQVTRSTQESGALRQRLELPSGAQNGAQ